MFEMKFKEMCEHIKAGLIEEHGLSFLSLTKEKQSAMICEKYLEYVGKLKERQV